MKKTVLILFFAFTLLGILFLYQYLKFYDGKLHVVFCDAGQGDAIFLRTPKGSDILIDGGPDHSVLNCLGKHMPFWDRTIEAVLLTHPHADHLTGLISVIKRYKVIGFYTERVSSKSAVYQELIGVLEMQNIRKQFLYQGDEFSAKDGFKFLVIAPTREFIEQTSPGGDINESAEFASLINYISYGSFSLVLTGDSQIEELKDAIQSFGLKQIDILQVPHHGSKTGLDKEILDLLNPKLAVISVGAKNRYGHPSADILKILREKDIKILRTDLPADATHQALQAGQNGEVEIVSDGVNFTFKNRN